MVDAQARPERRREAGDRPEIWAGYGKLLKLYRERRGLTQQALAQLIGYAPETVASVEQGRRPAKSVFTDAAERELAADGALRALQDSVDRACLPRFFQDFALLEAESVSRFSYDPLLIPGLLQTPDYARALLRQHYPPLNDESVDELVEARLARQSLLHRSNPPLALVFIIEESVLRRSVGTVELMRAQYRHLRELAELRNVIVQVSETRRGAHSGLNGAMVLLETQERRQLVGIESQGVLTVLSDRPRVSEFWLRYGMLRSQALDCDNTAKFVSNLEGEL